MQRNWCYQNDINEAITSLEKVFVEIFWSDPQSPGPPSPSPSQCSASQWPPRPEPKKKYRMKLSTCRWWNGKTKNQKPVSSTQAAPEPWGAGLSQDLNLVTKKHYFVVNNVSPFTDTPCSFTFSWRRPSGKRIQLSIRTRPPTLPKCRQRLELQPMQSWVVIRMTNLKSIIMIQCSCLFFRVKIM